MKKALKVILNYLEDILIISGLALITGTTFFIDKIAGCYATGIILFGLGAYFARNPIGRR